MWRGCRMRPPATRARSRSSLQPPRTPKKQRAPRPKKTALRPTLHTCTANYCAKSAQTEKQHPRSGPHRTPPHLHPRIAHLHPASTPRAPALPSPALRPTLHTSNPNYCAKWAQTQGGSRVRWMWGMQSGPQRWLRGCVRAYFAHLHRDLLCKVGPNADGGMWASTRMEGGRGLGGWTRMEGGARMRRRGAGWMRKEGGYGSRRQPGKNNPCATWEKS